MMMRRTFSLHLLNHMPSRTGGVLAERQMLRGLGGGCQVPIGAVTRIDGDTLTLRGVVLPPDGSSRIEAERKRSRGASGGTRRGSRSANCGMGARSC